MVRGGDNRHDRLGEICHEARQDSLQKHPSRGRARVGDARIRRWDLSEELEADLGSVA
jgi:hypothetical protein